MLLTSAKERVFCSGANIFMLGVSSHAWKVNFCKFTNETRNGLEDSSKHSGLKFLAAVNGACAGGGYELALACDEIMLVDDRSQRGQPARGAAAGRAARHRRADPRDRQAPCAPRPGRHLLHHHRRRARPEGQGLAAGRRHRQARSSSPQKVQRTRAANWPRKATGRPAPRAWTLAPLHAHDRGRCAALSACHGRDRPRQAHGRPSPSRRRGRAAQPRSPDIEAAGAAWYPLALARELEDAILSMRTNELEIGTWLIKTEGDAAAVLRHATPR